MLTHILVGAGGTLLGAVLNSLFGTSIKTYVSAELAKVKAEILAEVQNIKSKL